MAQTLVPVNELAARLDELLELAASGTEIILTDESGPRGRLLALPKTAGHHVLGLHPGAMRMSPDFDAPLLDSFWSP